MVELNGDRNLSAPLLVVEDSDEDFTALTRVLNSCGFTGEIYRTSDGDEALDFLYHEGEYENQANAPRPALVLIDLNLPGIDGREVIEEVKQHEELKTIPMVVLTTSSSPKDIETCYRYGANSYMLKPIGTQALKQSIQCLMDYWLKTAILPNGVQK
ncbi:response regulator [Phormidium sp. CCY1219]|jgi:CheY-like chemotaxis protein|uniref:response regulator n=1 Tax=Phormidium sp. CCY1219 TaxID=2886104 RepID=UPI002D1F8194|nr:response regulator [Phormidium sp. CCY1219]MEB3829075.1 response regulator [Phormidium sp. CCY1219]